MPLPHERYPTVLTTEPPHVAGRLSRVLPTELVLVIWSMMTLKDLIRYGYTSKLNLEAVQAFLYRKRLHLIRPFFSNPHAFLHVLKHTKSIVSGSLALAFVVPAESLGWFPKDMDLYTTKRSVKRWIQYLIHCGYRLKKASAVRLDGYPVHSEIREVLYFDNPSSGRRLDLIVSMTIAAKPIFCYHSTIVMNCFTGHGFFTAYPNLTSSLRGLMNPSTLIDYNIPPSHVATCFRKYGERGFSLAERPTAWSDDNHRCGRSWGCPETLRHTGDRGCLFIDFGEESVHAPEAVGDTLEIVEDTEQVDGDAVLGDRHGVIWRLGGYTCDGRSEVCQPTLDIF
jgi:hypothetical protein